ncbi:ankyrin [Thecamonas trahens ATCC 50062]|uniref:Ankyrin n=1 Tax=Thecamonas trahens ATCC 50062 TaxID=461836 RepID=A0A0L0D2Y7_THETB|nr:ankyrin [Thecamonas trahens ATCC 50062]KNC46659.1 ankyrin [Thecamonas trahens ATCC 50062]|eukprot:XP_013760432.1 ankyrin [Thecamonas trahens ATCC 50062]
MRASTASALALALGLAWLVAACRAADGDGRAALDDAMWAAVSSAAVATESGGERQPVYEAELALAAAEASAEARIKQAQASGLSDRAAGKLQALLQASDPSGPSQPGVSDLALLEAFYAKHAEVFVGESGGGAGDDGDGARVRILRKFHDKLPLPQVPGSSAQGPSSGSGAEAGWRSSGPDADEFVILPPATSRAELDDQVYLAALHNHVRDVRELIELGGDVDATPDERSGSALYAAAFHGHLDVVRTLIELGADVSAALGDGTTPLYAAAQRGHLAVCEALLQAGAVPDAGRRDGWRPLQIAAEQGHTAVARALVAAGADVNGGNAKGVTPLITATAHAHVPMMALLLDAGADPNRATLNGWGALDVLESAKGELDAPQLEAKALLEAHGALRASSWVALWRYGYVAVGMVAALGVWLLGPSDAPVTKSSNKRPSERAGNSDGASRRSGGGKRKGGRPRKRGRK